ncbi:hypothetical protein ACRALDRAFT_1063653 [Sodiomyces alcalophilus JCM 7366]|uniref:uncharacterized protein n=1 Tax=Sodiomyces alcalophilus JCM 7366 TaxID=591952 RepID=UPI0039B514A3
MPRRRLPCVRRTILNLRPRETDTGRKDCSYVKQEEVDDIRVIQAALVALVRATEIFRLVEPVVLLLVCVCCVEIIITMRAWLDNLGPIVEGQAVFRVRTSRISCDHVGGPSVQSLSDLF